MNSAEALPGSERGVRLYIGTEKHGIVTAMVDPKTGAVSPGEPPQGSSPAFFLAWHPFKRVLYALDHLAAEVAAFAVEPGGGLRELNRVSSRGAVPCHLAVEPGGDFLIVASYGGGVVLCPLDGDGRLGEARGLYSGPDGSHPHGITFSPCGGVVHVTDLGSDRIHALRIDRPSLAATAVPEGEGSVERGSGPRHFSFSPSGRSAVVVNELASTAVLFSYDRESGRLEQRDAASLVPTGFSGVNRAAEIAYHPSGRTCHACNRGHDSIAIFQVDEVAGKLSLLRWVESGLKEPQHFAFDRQGAWMAVASRGSNQAAIFHVGGADGSSLESRGSISVPRPMCVLIDDAPPDRPAPPL